jgi:hypothetical protein
MSSALFTSTSKRPNRSTAPSTSSRTAAAVMSIVNQVAEGAELLRRLLALLVASPADRALGSFLYQVLGDRVLDAPVYPR